MRSPLAEQDRQQRIGLLFGLALVSVMLWQTTLGMLVLYPFTILATWFHEMGHGIAAMLLGGAVAGGKVIADWPGLSRSALYEGRDLKPTTDLDALIASALAQHYNLEPARVAATLFPEIRGSMPRQSLIA